MGTWIWDVLFIAVLVLCSITDIRKREISIGVVAAGIIIRAVGGSDCFRRGLLSLFCACLPGLCVMGLSILSDGKIGFGDGIVIGMGGIFYSGWMVINWIFYASLLCALFGGLLVVSGRGGRKKELPFLPFLTISAAFLIPGFKGG